MSKQHFNSTLQEKKDLLARLQAESSHSDIRDAIRVVEDAILLHELHREVQTAVGMLEKHKQTSTSYLASNAINSSISNFDNFYKKVVRRKIRQRIR